MSRARGSHRTTLSMGLMLAWMAACSEADLRAPGALTSGTGTGNTPPVVTPTPTPGCVDDDGDTYGEGCVPGPDCNDHDVTSTNECRQCLRPDTGCPCAEGEDPVPCNVDTGTTEVGPDNICHLGQRVCRGGAWSTCEALGASSSRIVGSVSQCYGQCDPTCKHIVDCVTPGDTLPPGSTFVSTSTLPAAVFCPAGTARGGLQPQCENRPGGPYARATSPLTWIDACAAPGSQSVLTGADEGLATVAIPYAFSYWGVPYRSVTVTPNGVAQFALSSSQWINTTLPSPSAPNAVLAFWDDLLLRDNGICIATVGTAPNRRTVIQWADAAFYPVADASTHLNFEVVLSEATQTVDVLYQTMQGTSDTATGSSATIGVQEGGGTRFDLVGYNTPGVATAGTGFRWSPTSNDQYCERGTYVRVYEAACGASAVATVPTWGLINFTSYVPPGAAIRMRVRAADTVADLFTATTIRLPDAPRNTASATPIATQYDLGDILAASDPHLAHARYVAFEAVFDPGPDLNLAPALGSVEVQFRCRPVEAPFRCVAGSPCLSSGVCRRGVIACTHPVVPVCVDAGPLPVGTACGTGSVCNSAGNCVPCNEGASCSTGNACEFGRISCATGAPVCQRVANLPSGTICGFGGGAYTRDASSLGWIDACALPGATTWLTTSTDGVADFTLPFPFNFYGTVRTQVGVSVNGVLGFPTVANAWTNAALPTTSLGDAVLPFWDDLQTRPQGLCVASLGRAPSRLWVAQWANADLQDRGTSGDVGASLNFEVVLEESTHAVNVIYGDLVGDARSLGASATVGLQRGDGSRFDQVSFNTGTLRANSSFRWVPPVASTCDGSGTCTPCATTETCDGRDNNCNALVDEGIPDLSCGIGACRRTVAACVRGVTQTCTPGTPTSEVCNGLDDNCNGQVDEMCMGSIACPADVTMWAGDTQSLSVTSMGMLRGYTWSIVSAPSGGDTSAVWNPAPPTATTETFRPIIVGTYRIQVSAIDGLNQTRSCQFNVTANSRGLRVELTWNGTGDVDLHLHNNVSGAWFSVPNDAFYSNMSPAWGASQDVDNVTSNGPENIRVNTPAVGQTYTIGVHNYARAAGRTATVRVYCGPSAGTTPMAVYTSSPLTGSSTGNCTSNTFWKVANVLINADGTCTLTALNNYTTSSNACTTR